MSELKVVDKFEVMSLETGEIIQLLDNTLPIKERIDGIGYIKAQVENRIDLIKQRVKDLTLDRKQLEELVDVLKEATKEGLISSNDTISRGLETKAWLSKRTKNLLLVDESEIDDNEREHTITIKGLTFNQLQELYGIAWEKLGIKTTDIKASSKINLDTLPDKYVAKEEYHTVSFSRAGATINE